MADLKLGKLPNRTPVKLSITITPNLQENLRRYAAAYTDAYGVDEPLVELIPAMLAAFLDADKGFAKRRRTGPASDG